MHKIIIAFLFLILHNLQARVLFEEILSKLPNNKKITFSGTKFLVGTLQLEIEVQKKSNTEIEIHNHEKVYVLGVRVHQSTITSRINLKDYKPQTTVYRDFHKTSMRFNFFYDNFYRYIRITQFKDLIDIDSSGKIISPKNFNPKNHSIKNRVLKYNEKNTLIFDPNLLLISIPYIDGPFLKKIETAELLFATMDHVIPFKITIEKEDKKYRYLNLTYPNTHSDKIDLKIESLKINLKKNILQEIQGSEKHVGSVKISLKELKIM